MSRPPNTKIAKVIFTFTLLSLTAACNTNQTEAKDLLEKARQQFAAGNFRSNADLLARAAQLDPTNELVWSRLCEAYQLTEEFDKAASSCKKAIELKPSDIAFNSLGLVFLDKNDYKSAAEAFEKAAAQSKNTAIHNNLVWALIGSKQYEKAIPAARRLIELSKDEPPELRATHSAHELLGVALQASGQNEAAMQEFKATNMKTCEMKTDGKGKVSLECKG